MTLRLAAAQDPARTAGRHAERRGLVARVQRAAANDHDTPAHGVAALDPVVIAALRHFAVHGLDAANAARTCAEDARQVGDIAAVQHWQAITGMFDRRAAVTSPHRSP
jgi:hypothetical protein